MIVSPNKLLAALSREDYQRIAPQLETVSLKFRQVLHKEGEKIRDIYFPGGGACSLTKLMQDGRTAQLAIIGNEGIIGPSVCFAEDQSPADTIVQVADNACQMMNVQAFNDEIARRGTFYNRAVRYSQALLAQVMQITACNGLHSAEERCCRWLLMTSDRVASDEFQLTHEFVAAMLGVRRPTVTVIMGGLHQAGLIQYRRHSIRIVDRKRLEAGCCECYEAVNGYYRNLLPEITGPITRHVIGS